MRRPLITAGNFAEMILPVEHWPGMPTIDSPFYPPDTPVCHWFAAVVARSRSIRLWHIGGVANQLIIGPTATGKSALLGATVAATTALPLLSDRLAQSKISFYSDWVAREVSHSSPGNFKTPRDPLPWWGERTTT